MRLRVVTLASAALLLPTAAIAYDFVKMAELTETCLRSKHNTPKDQIIAACTLLIREEPNPKGLIGQYYLSRAVATDYAQRASACQDVRKALELMPQAHRPPKHLIPAAERLAASVCN